MNEAPGNFRHWIVDGSRRVQTETQPVSLVFADVNALMTIGEKRSTTDTYCGTTGPCKGAFLVPARRGMWDTIPGWASLPNFSTRALCGVHPSRSCSAFAASVVFKPYLNKQIGQGFA